MIKIEDYEKVLNIELTPNQHFLYSIIESKRLDLFSKYLSIDREDKIKNDLHILWRKDLITGFDESNYLITFESLSVTNQPKTVSLVTEDPFYIECWELFPKGVKTGGYPVKSDKKDFIKKLTRFEKEYKQYERPLIKQAFESYINTLKKTNYQFMMQAGYFIFKMDNHRSERSMLATFCEELLNKPENYDDGTDKFSRNF